MSSVPDDIMKKFLTGTDHSGRFLVTSHRTGRTYAIEPIGDPHIEWGSVDPADSGPGGKLMHKKGDGKYRGSVDAEDSLITEENGFKNIHMIEVGMSPHSYIDWVDSQYPDKVEVKESDEDTTTTGC